MRNLSRTMMGRLTALLLMGVLVAVMTGACGSDPTATPAPTATPVPPTATPVPSQPSDPAPDPTATPTPDAMMMFKSEWEDLIAAAQEEGEVTIVMGGSASRNYRPVVAVFEKSRITATSQPQRRRADGPRLAEQSADATRRCAHDQAALGTAAISCRGAGSDPSAPHPPGGYERRWLVPGEGLVLGCCDAAVCPEPWRSGVSREPGHALQHGPGHPGGHRRDELCL